MTHQQWEAIERKLMGLSPEEKLELVERLVRELRAAAPLDRRSSAPATSPLTEAEFKQRLLEAGLMTSLPTPSDATARPAWQPIEIEGEPLSETIIRERR